MQTHTFVGEGKFCSECGQGRDAEVHQAKEPSPGSSDLAATIGLLTQILASNKAQEKKLDELRDAVTKGMKDAAKQLAAAIAAGGLGGLLGKK